MPKNQSDEKFAKKEAKARFESALRGAFKTLAEPESEAKIGKPKASRGKSAATTKHNRTSKDR